MRVRPPFVLGPPALPPSSNRAGTAPRRSFRRLCEQPRTDRIGLRPGVAGERRKIGDAARIAKLAPRVRAARVPASLAYTRAVAYITPSSTIAPCCPCRPPCDRPRSLPVSAGSPHRRGRADRARGAMSRTRSCRTLSAVPMSDGAMSETPLISAGLSGSVGSAAIRSHSTRSADCAQACAVANTSRLAREQRRRASG